MIAAIRRFKAQRSRSATEFAQQLGISRTHLYRAMRDLPRKGHPIVAKSSLADAAEKILGQLCAERRAAKRFKHVSAKIVYAALPKKFRVVSSVPVVARIIRDSGMRDRHPQTAVTQQDRDLLLEYEIVLTPNDISRMAASQRLGGW